MIVERISVPMPTRKDGQSKQNKGSQDHKGLKERNSHTDNIAQPLLAEVTKINLMKRSNLDIY